MSHKKVTVTAPANIAFIKYWGATDLKRAIPHHPSISMTLKECCSRTTVEHRDEGEHEIYLLHEDGSLQPATGSFHQRAAAHLDRMLEWAGRSGSFRVETRNSFPAAAGMASSASGFAALTLAAAEALGVELAPRERSELARRSGSGSASRSVFGGYVEWPAAAWEEGSGDDCYAEVLAPAEHWALADVIALVETGPKDVSSLDGHRRATTSPHFARRLELIPERLERTRRAIRERDFPTLGVVIEEDAIELHLIAMSSQPPIFYWKPATLAVLEAVRALRQEGLPAYSTMDAGANVHVICEAAHSAAVAATLAKVPGVVGVIEDRVGPGPRMETGVETGAGSAAP
jgi:diphosphomevalonate decarboxylase